MKTVTTNTVSAVSLILGLGLSNLAEAKNISDLTLHCHGTYQVVSATSYYIAPVYNTRATPQAFAGAKEQIKINSLYGDDCKKLKPFYGIDLQIGMTLPYNMGTSPETPEHAEAFAQAELHKSYPFKVHQSFSYQLAHGDLPLFPQIHSEYAEVLGLGGAAKSKELYGTPTVMDLDDASKKKITEYLFDMKDWGKSYQSSLQFDSDQWLQLLVQLDFKDNNLELEYIQNLVLFFNNSVKKTNQFYSGNASSLIAKKIASLLNTFGKSKWSTKLQILEGNPALLNKESIVWSKPEEVLNLTSAEIEEFLQYALVQVQALSQVPKVNEALILKYQYKGAAEALKSKPLGEDKHFELSPKSEELISAIQLL